MAIDTQRIEVESNDHIVRFYEHDRELAGVQGQMVDVQGQMVEADRRTHDRCPKVDRTDLTAVFPAERDAPGRARRLVLATLRSWGCDQAIVDDVALVATELASNAVLHAGSSFSISVRRQDSMLRVAVCDGTSPDPVASEGGLTPRPRRGLGLIDALATRWGMQHTLGGKVVWAELAEPVPFETSAQEV